MTNSELGNPIRLLTEYYGIVAEIYEYHYKIAESITEQHMGHDNFHSMLSRLIRKLGAAVEKLPKTDLEKQFDEIQNRAQTINGEVQSAELKSNLDEIDSIVNSKVWAEVKEHYGKPDYIADHDKFKKVSHIIESEIKALHEIIKDILINAFVEYYSMGPMQKNAQKELLAANVSLIWPDTVLWIKNNAESVSIVHDEFKIKKDNPKDIIKLLLSHHRLDAYLLYIEDRYNWITLFANALNAGDDSIADPFDLHMPGAHPPEEIYSSMSSKILYMKELLLKIMPATIKNSYNNEQQAIAERIKELKIKIAYASHDEVDDYNEWISIGELQRAVTENRDKLISDIKEMDVLRDINFMNGEYEAMFKYDYEQTIMAYNSGLYKFVAQGCGSVLETILREFLSREQNTIERLVNEKQETIFGKSIAPYIKINDVKTWSLFPLIRATREITRNAHPEYINMFEVLMRSRNRVHGGKVDKTAATFGLTVIKIAGEYLLT